MAKQIGYYNATHRHGDPLENMIQKLKARRNGAAGANQGVPGAVRDHSLDPTQAGYNRTNAPMGPVPPWVAAQMAAGKGLMHPGAVPPAGGVPPGVVPTKPVQAVQGSDALTGLQPAGYPLRRPTPQRPRRLPSWLLDRSSR